MKNVKTTLALALILMVLALVLTGCGDQSTSSAESTSSVENTSTSSEKEEVIHTPDEVLMDRNNQRIEKSDDYDLIYTGHSVELYRLGEPINGVELGNEASYGGFSKNGAHYFLVDDTVKVVTLKNELKAETISTDIKHIIDADFYFNDDDKSALLVETLDGEFKIWVYGHTWVTDFDQIDTQYLYRVVEN